MDAGAVVVAVEHYRPAVLGVEPHAPGQVVPVGVGGEGQPAALIPAGDGPVLPAPHATAAPAPDRLDRLGVVEGDVGVVDERQLGDGVVGPEPVRHGVVPIGNHVLYTFRRERCINLQRTR